MIGKTNAVVGGGVTPTEKVNLTITSNQADSSDLIGVGFGIAYGFGGGYGEAYVWEGKPITLDIPQYVTYFISFNEVPGYKTPNLLYFTAVPNNVRQINVEYQTEVVTVTVSADNGASVSGQKVTINGVTTTLTRTGKVSQKVPYGTSYSVSVNDKSGYNTPATQTFTASQPARSVSMVYEEIRLGVFIQDTTGKLWTASAWNGSATPNGVAVLTDACRFVIALSEKSSILIDPNGYSSSINLPIYFSGSEAITDFSGASNTTAMISVYGNTKSEAAGYCANFIFPNGKSGYLGSAGEWEAVYDNKSAVIDCMATVFGTPFAGNQYWTSTRGENLPYDSNYDMGPFNSFWSIEWSYGALYFYAPYGYLYARPFTTL